MPDKSKRLLNDSDFKESKVDLKKTAESGLKIIYEFLPITETEADIQRRIDQAYDVLFESIFKNK